MFFSFTRSDMISCAFFDPAHKKGGDLHHPIFNAVGTKSSDLPRDTGLPSAAEGAQ